MKKCSQRELKELLSKFTSRDSGIKKSKLYNRINEWTEKKYQITFYECMQITLGNIAVIIAISYIFYGNLYAVVVLSPYLYFSLKEKAEVIVRKKKKKLNNEFKDAIVSISFALNVGYSIENAFKESISELTMLHGKDSEIVKEFKNIVRRIERNENLENALEEFAVKSGVNDIKYFSSVFKYAKRCGGDLIAIIKSTTEKISEKLEVNNEVQTMISGKKMEQKVMGLIPFGIILYLKLTAKEFIEPLYGNVTGVVIMTVCLIIYAVSYYLSKRIVNIEI